MNAELYIVPVGMVDQQIVSSIEVYIPDLKLIVSPENSSLIDADDASERYEELKKIGDIEIADEEKQNYEQLAAAIATKNTCEEECLSLLDAVISETVQKFQSEPQIHIPDAFEAGEVLGNSGIILEG